MLTFGEMVLGEVVLGEVAIGKIILGEADPNLPILVGRHDNFWYQLMILYTARLTKHY